MHGDRVQSDVVVPRQQRCGGEHLAAASGVSRTSTSPLGSVKTVLAKSSAAPRTRRHVSQSQKVETQHLAICGRASHIVRRGFDGSRYYRPYVRRSIIGERRNKRAG
jgi:hypothetical protein